MLIITCHAPLTAQRGGESVFGLLNLTQSAKVASLGGNQVGIEGADLSILINNPSMLDSTHSNQISVNFTPYMAGINYGHGAYSRSFSGVGNFALGFFNVGYGKFVAADETGIITGDFTANETVIQMVYSRRIFPHWHVGASVKPVFSRIETYKSWGLAFDAGLFYRSNNGLTTAGFVLRNVGRQIDAYYETIEKIKPDFQIGISTKLAHAPFRFSVTMQDIFSGTLLYDIPDENKNTAFQDNNSSKGGFADDVFRRFTFGVEFVPSKNFYVAGGYNPRMRHDLKIDSKTSTVGFTWGFGFRVNKFHFAYGSGRYHLGGTTNHFSVTTNLSSF